MESLFQEVGGLPFLVLERVCFDASLQEALEDRLDRVNRELGSIRMILKRFHVLRTSANI